MRSQPLSRLVGSSELPYFVGQNSAISGPMNCQSCSAMMVRDAAKMAGVRAQWMSAANGERFRTHLSGRCPTRQRKGHLPTTSEGIRE